MIEGLRVKHASLFFDMGIPISPHYQRCRYIDHAYYQYVIIKKPRGKSPMAEIKNPVAEKNTKKLDIKNKTIYNVSIHAIILRP
jgi:hypothetical protein